MTIQPDPLSYPFGEPDGLNIHPTYGELRKVDGMARVQPPYGTWAWLATRYHDVKTVLDDPRFSRAKAIGENEPRVHPFIPQADSLSALDPPEHTRLRRVLMKAFTARRVQQLRPRIQAIVDDCLDEMEKHGSPADLMDLLAIPVPVLMTCELLGVPYADREQFRIWSELILATSSMDVPPEQIFQAFQEMGVYLAGRLAQCREQPGDDLLSVLVQAHDEGDRLNESEMIGLASTVLVAGQETTVNQIGSFVYVLLTHPEKLQQLHQSPEMMPQAIEELLRVAPVTATAGFARVATEDVEVGGVQVRAGEIVMPTLFSANMDESVFPNPEELDFTRPNVSTHLAFSHGPHHCAGSQLARAELQITIASLLRRFPNLHLALPAEQVPWKKEVLSRGPRELLVGW